MGALKILDRDVVQANPLIRAKKEMTLTEMRLFVLGLQDITPHIRDDFVHDLDFHETKITHSELLELFGTDNNGNIDNLKKQVEKAYDGKIKLSYKDGGFGFRHIYRKMDYIPQDGLIILFDDEIKPYILDIVNQAYTKYKVKAFFSLQSAYAWRLLESILENQGFLKKGTDKIYKILSVEEVRFRLNVQDGMYNGRMNNFKRKVLDEPIADINKKTDYHVWYEVIKTGRKITGFKFWAEMKDKNKALPAAPETTKPPETSQPSSEPAATSPLPPAPEAVSTQEQELEKLGQTKLFATPPQPPAPSAPHHEQNQDDEKKKRQLFWDNEILFSKLSRYFLNEQIEELIIKYGAERVSSNYDYAERNKSGKRNMAGWIVSCIDCDHAAAERAINALNKQQAEREREELMARLEPMPKIELDPNDKRTVRERFADLKKDLRKKKG